MRQPSSGRLTLKDRKQIEFFLQQKFKVSSISQELGKKPNVVRYEILVNSDAGVYCASDAHKRALERRRISRRRPVQFDEEFSYYLRARLYERWSPEQIIARIRFDNIQIAGKTFVPPCIATVYKFIYQRTEQGENLSQHLFYRQTKRRTRRPKKEKVRNNFNRMPAAHDVNEWEADTITFLKSDKCVAVFTARDNYLVRLFLLEKREPEDMLKAAEHLLQEFSKEKVNKLYVDHGQESWCRRTLRHKYEIDVELCNRPWDKGLVENTNRLIRRYLSYFSPEEDLSEDTIKKIEHELNHRPRKYLGWMTPFEMANFYQLPLSS